jgi:hypothetical protein
MTAAPTDTLEARTAAPATRNATAISPAIRERSRVLTRVLDMKTPAGREVPEVRRDPARGQ